MGFHHIFHEIFLFENFFNLQNKGALVKNFKLQNIFLTFKCNLYLIYCFFYMNFLIFRLQNLFNNNLFL